MTQNNYNELINSVINHDHAAENKLYHLIHNFALRSVRTNQTRFSTSTHFDNCDLEDIASEVTNKVFESLYKDDFKSLRRFLEPDQNFHNYLSMTISRATLKDFTKQKKYLDKFTRLSDETAEQSEECYTFSSPHPLDVQLGFVAKLAEHLPEKQRLVINAILNNFEQLPESKLAQSIGLTPNQFARNKNAAIANLRELSVDYRDLSESDDLYCFAE